MQDVLAIIDLQPVFLERLKRRLQDHDIELLCKKNNLLIKHALKHDVHVTLVEFNGYDQYHGHTHPLVLNDIPNKLHTVDKSRDDGSREIWQALENLQIRPRTLTITGINRAYCVGSTGVGLFRKYNQTIYTVNECIECHLNMDGWGELRDCPTHVNLEPNDYQAGPEWIRSFKSLEDKPWIGHHTALPF